MALCLGGLLVGLARAEKFETTTGQTLSGDAVSFNEKGAVIRLDDGAYADRTEWAKFTQDSLKKLALIPKAAPFVEPLLEVTEEEKAAEAEKVALVIKTDYPKLERLEKSPGLFKSLFSTGIGLFALLLIYAGNIYAGYEISIFRARPTAVVCGVAAVLPILGPIIFLCLPTQIESKEGIIQEPMHEKESYHVGEPPVEGAEVAEVVDAGPQLPATQTFARGQFTFNRRFIETKFAGFFGVVRRESEKELLLIVKTGSGNHTAERISRVAGSEMYIQTSHGEVMIPFLDIQEVVLKHKDA